MSPQEMAGHFLSWAMEADPQYPDEVLELAKVIRSAQSQARDEALEEAAGEVQRVWREAPNHRTDSALTSFVQNAVGPGCHFAIETIRSLKASKP
jgi:hypothetical protein